MHQRRGNARDGSRPRRHGCDGRRRRGAPPPSGYASPSSPRSVTEILTPSPVREGISYLDATKIFIPPPPSLDPASPTNGDSDGITSRDGAADACGPSDDDIAGSSLAPTASNDASKPSINPNAFEPPYAIANMTDDDVNPHSLSNENYVKPCIPSIQFVCFATICLLLFAQQSCFVVLCILFAACAYSSYKSTYTAPTYSIPSTRIHHVASWTLSIASLIMLVLRQVKQMLIAWRRNKEHQNLDERHIQQLHRKQVLQELRRTAKRNYLAHTRSQGTASSHRNCIIRYGSLVNNHDHQKRQYDTQEEAEEVIERMHSQGYDSEGRLTTYYNLEYRKWFVGRMWQERVHDCILQKDHPAANAESKMADLSIGPELTLY
ncbi:hypothetical protein ACHAWF_018092 [Thalassiosira exigua]